MNLPSRFNLPSLFWLCLLTSAVLTTAALSQDRSDSGTRVALVIGNADYPDSSTPLATTTKDARTLAEEFRRLDFNVDLRENVNKDDMRRAIDAFTGKITRGTVALFYFSGFGLQVERQTYLVPVNAQIWSEADARRDGISLDAILVEMHRRGARVKIVIIDASRRNPFERRFRASPAGLAPLNAPEGTLAMYTAAPGAVMNDNTGGANSLFVSEFIKELHAPNRTAEEIFNHTRIGVSRASNNEQVPWGASSLVEEFRFSQGNAVARTPERPQTIPRPVPQPQPTPAPPPKDEHPTSTAGSKPGDIFRDCPDCPELVVVAAGTFNMGSALEYQNPVHSVKIAKLFAIGRYEVTFDQWDKCLEEGGCKNRIDDQGWGRGKRPVIDVSWLDAKAYLAWLSKKTNQKYRLPSEAEWEYAARARTTTPFWWGRTVGTGQANCRDCQGTDQQRTSPVGTYKPNAFGLYDTSGNAAEWVEDCWNNDYRGAPTNGAAWTSGECRLRVLRGGAFDSQQSYLQSASRFRYDQDVPYVANGFRVVRELQ